MEREVGNLASVPEVIESEDSRIGGVSFSISWILRSDCLHNSTPNILYYLLTKQRQSNAGYVTIGNFIDSLVIQDDKRNCYLPFGHCCRRRKETYQ